LIVINATDKEGYQILILPFSVNEKLDSLCGSLCQLSEIYLKVPRSHRDIFIRLYTNLRSGEIWNCIPYWKGQELPNESTHDGGKLSFLPLLWHLTFEQGCCDKEKKWSDASHEEAQLKALDRSVRTTGSDVTSRQFVFGLNLSRSRLQMKCVIVGLETHTIIFIQKVQFQRYG